MVEFERNFHIEKFCFTKSCKKIPKKFWDVDFSLPIPKILNVFMVPGQNFSNIRFGNKFFQKTRKLQYSDGKFWKNGRRRRNEGENNFCNLKSIRKGLVKFPKWLKIVRNLHTENFCFWKSCQKIRKNSGIEFLTCVFMAQDFRNIKLTSVGWNLKENV